MFGIGMPEMLLILAIALIVIGPQKLPDLARSLGKALGEFKKATNDLKDSIQLDTEIKDVKNTFENIEKDFKEDHSTASNFSSDSPIDSTEPEKTSETENVNPLAAANDLKEKTSSKGKKENPPTPEMPDSNENKTAKEIEKGQPT